MKIIYVTLSNTVLRHSEDIIPRPTGCLPEVSKDNSEITAALSFLESLSNI